MSEQAPSASARSPDQSIGEQLEAFVTYDLRLADAARASGLTVATPT
jgi:hypothetical protein